MLHHLMTTSQWKCPLYANWPDLFAESQLRGEGESILGFNMDVHMKWGPRWDPRGGSNFVLNFYVNWHQKWSSWLSELT